MNAVWTTQPCTADQVRRALARKLTDSSVRTVLRRLEQKGYVKHASEGRAFVYRGVDRRHAAISALRKVIDRFCGGSVEELLVGMVDKEIVDPRELKRLADKIARKKEET